MVAEALDMLNMLNAPHALDGIVGWHGNLAVRRAEFLDSVRAWRLLLERTPGHKFSLYFEDSIAFAAALFGAWQADKTIYLPADTLPATCAALREHVDGFMGEFPAEWSPLAIAAGTGGTSPLEFKTLESDFVGLVVHTSGSTGAAQPIPKKLSQLDAEVRTLEALFGDRLQSAEIVATVSHQHIYGLLFKVLWPLTAGRAVHGHSIAYPEELAALLASRDCVLVSSPAHLKRLPDNSIWDNVKSHLRAVFSSGGPLPIEASKETTRLLGHAPIEIYGSSETGGVAWRQRCEPSDESWTPMPGVRWRIDSIEGVLEVSSAHLPDRNWFVLSDRAVPASGDGFQLQGRVDRIVKIEEKRISLDSIEKQLAGSPLVVDARVVVTDGSQDKRQRVAAFVVLSAQGRECLAASGKLALNRALRDLLSNVIEPVALPRVWRYVDALPINAQGKTTRAALLALLEKTETERPKLPHERVLKKEENRVVFELIVPSNLVYLEGHFPQIPILAGVVQIDWVIRYARQHFDVPPLFRSIHALKFQRVIRPEEPVELELLYEPVKASLSFSYSSAAGQHAAGRLQFGAGDV
jgi:acyl-CoA synthetase (AMP-forming)/AMP-acid ligase II/3-hydroxymyristoyl/3-hydroxydecanoyl-(acyl carrier protein) dehydratase